MTAGEINRDDLEYARPRAERERPPEFVGIKREKARWNALPRLPELAATGTCQVDGRSTPDGQYVIHGEEPLWTMPRRLARR